MRKSGRWVFILIFGICAVVWLTDCQRKIPSLAKQVIIIGIDGMGAQGFLNADIPNLKQLAKEGALTLHARNVMPTVSKPCWGSILMGAGPEQHGVTSNAWLVTKHTLEPMAKDANGYFPSIFSVIRKNVPDAEMGIFFDWPELADIFNAKYLNELVPTKNMGETFALSIPYIVEKKPRLVFLYIGHPDEVGHDKGYASSEFYQSLAQVDGKIGELVAALKAAGSYDQAHILIVADHGGVEKGHGGETMLEVEVPWIISGPGVVRGVIISQPVNIYDTASTVLYLFHLVQPPEWTGRPVLGAFSVNKELAEK
jgi:predicted AlkP superfamily pyrophosphatase or phosphodiesterase